jgi:hypothetical protein
MAPLLIRFNDQNSRLMLPIPGSGGGNCQAVVCAQRIFDEGTLLYYTPGEAGILTRVNGVKTAGEDS